MPYLFFLKSHLEVQEVEKQAILIEVKDVQSIGKDSLIGEYELDLPYVYMQESHCIKHAWVALANTEAEDY